MAKCLRNKDNKTILRINDAAAKQIMDTEGHLWEYIPKSVWKRAQANAAEKDKRSGHTRSR